MRDAHASGETDLCWRSEIRTEWKLLAFPLVLAYLLARTSVLMNFLSGILLSH